ncbi:protein FAR1-RELATED SEQUENCE 11-like [Chenopodium quinoa]|uniref:protein FAR1-RELATED SEQUENCE 11-like n=1 Tax=Chenopodium quinoa TaxID=63459 RepID=UPI000B785BFD|nr:protein FAR1-RELATED SEQUENCE 11-like [Chenopodium quinoa]
MELQKNVKHGELSFLEKDVRNLFSRVKRELDMDDIKNLFEHMKLAKQESPLFQYAYTIDNENKLENLFWCRAQSFDCYQKYGDVVVFDTTYKVNSYNMPCGIFVGIDNHGKTILFGCALLRNETTSTFKWLMKTFVTIMKKVPKTILTDQDPWMSEATTIEMPSTKHSFCIWHITSKFSCWFAALLRDDYQTWCGDFYKLYKMTNPEEFEQHWPLMVAKYNMEDNKHIQGLYEIRGFRAPAYLRDSFFWRDDNYRKIGKYKRVYQAVDIGVEEIIQGHAHLSLNALIKPTSLKTKSPLEEQVFGVFTPFAFKKFQDELTRATLYSIIHVEGHEFTVRYYEGDDKISHRVFWDGKNTAMCSCKIFEFWGILCRHILRVLFHKDCFKIPLSYLPLRWCCDALQDTTSTQEDALQANISTQEVVQEEMFSVEELTPTINASMGDVLCPPQSKTKGRPKKKREKGGKEVAKKKTKSCSICKQPGHTKPTCPYKENILPHKLQMMIEE